MKYEEKKKIIEAAEILKEYCKKSCCNSDNSNCLFEKTKGVCSIRKDYPTAWEIPKFTPWTVEDVDLAKSLKKFGVIKIYQVGKVVMWEDEYLRTGMLPEGVFKSLDKKFEYIDTIIKQAEE